MKTAEVWNWMDAEFRFAEVLALNFWYVKKITDSKAARNLVEPNPADFIVAKRFQSFFFEVKHSVKFPFPMENIGAKKSQIKEVTRALNRGLPVLYAVFVTLDQPKFRIYSGFDIISVINSKLSLKDIPHLEVIDKMPEPEILMDFFVKTIKKIEPKKHKRKEPTREISRGW